MSVLTWHYCSGGLVYVCGKVSMAEAVTDAIIEAIDKHMTQEDREETSAAEYVNAMKDAGRFNLDIFGKWYHGQDSKESTPRVVFLLKALLLMYATSLQMND